MRMKTVGAGPHPDVSVAGGIITLGEAIVDCAERQEDSAVVVDLRQPQNGPITEGGDGRQLASIHIPPKRYVEVDTGETDEQGEPIIERQAEPLDADQVAVTLWTTHQ